MCVLSKLDAVIVLQMRPSNMLRCTCFRTACHAQPPIACTDDAVHCRLLLCCLLLQFQNEAQGVCPETVAALHAMWQADTSLPVFCCNKESGIMAKGTFRIVNGVKQIELLEGPTKEKGTVMSPADFEREGDRILTKNWQLSVCVEGECVVLELDQQAGCLLAAGKGQEGPRKCVVLVSSAIMHLAVLKRELRLHAHAAGK